jgi:hypothetical protein
VSDTRRVCDLTAAELLEAGFAHFAELGWTHGLWKVEALLDDGRVRKVLPAPAGDRPVTLGRGELDRLDRELGSAA